MNLLKWKKIKVMNAARKFLLMFLISLLKILLRKKKLLSLFHTAVMQNVYPLILIVHKTVAVKVLSAVKPKKKILSNIFL